MTTTAKHLTLAILDGSCELDRDEIGGKAWGVNRMAGLGMPVPPAFCLPTTHCANVNEIGSLPEDLSAALREGVAHVEEQTGRSFGGTSRPLLVSVRSGAARSMPGMMDTILNLGITPSTATALQDEGGTAEWVEALSERFTEQYRKVVEAEPSQDDPWSQLEQAVLAVYRSWNSDRAVTYRRHQQLDDHAGTAVTVQAMVFGNLDDRSGTGVLFSRNPLDGSPAPYGEWLVRAQGEDVVAGTATPARLADLETFDADLHAELLTAAARLESDARDVQDIEFTIESGRLWVLQTRTAKRAPGAAVELAVHMVDDDVLTPEEAVLRVTPDQLAKVLGDVGGAGDDLPELARGEAACPGTATGIAVTDPDEAADRADAGESVILVRPTTTTDDVHGMLVAAAVVTDLGGSTSHAALVSREIGVPCVVGCGVGTTEQLAGRLVTVDGKRGVIYEGRPAGASTAATENSVRDRFVGWVREQAGTDAPEDPVGALTVIHERNV